MRNQAFINKACLFGNPWEYNDDHVIYLNWLLADNIDLNNTVFDELCDYIELHEEDNTNTHIYGLHTYMQACRDVE